MYLCYIDESGNTGSNLKDAHQPYLVLVALMLPPEKIKEVESDLRLLGYKYFGAESRNTDFEFHGDAIYNGRKKNKYFHKLPQDKRLEILDELVNITIKHDSIRIGYVAIEKEKYYGKLHVQQTAFQLIVEKIEERLQGYLNSYCLLIADEQDELEQRLIDDLDHFKQHGTSLEHRSIQVDRIIDSVHFVKSKNNYLMQLTDVICYLVRKGKESEMKLISAWKESKASIEYTDWVENFGNKGQKYFLNTYRLLGSKKVWLFSKDFPDNKSANKGSLEQWLASANQLFASMDNIID